MVGQASSDMICHLQLVILARCILMPVLALFGLLLGQESGVALCRKDEWLMWLIGAEYDPSWE